MARVAGVDTIIILSGGPSPEAAVSRSSSAGIKTACERLGYAVELWELAGDWLIRLAHAARERHESGREGLFVFIGLHGAPGEDGTVQGVLELLGLPYQGSGVAGSAVAMDKLLTVSVLRAAGLPVAEGLSGDDLQDDHVVAVFLENHGALVVKPVNGGSSVGVSRVENMQAWEKALALAERYGPAMVEAFVPGRELTVTVLRGMQDLRTLPVVEILTPDNRWYDYDSKYSVGGSTHVVPAELPEGVAEQVRRVAGQAAAAVDARGACRVDLRYDAATQALVILEVNTLPGMTPTSLAPDAARAEGVDYTALVSWMIEDGMRWFRHRT